MDLDMKQESGVWMQLSTGSVSNLKPELVMEGVLQMVRG